MKVTDQFPTEPIDRLRQAVEQSWLAVKSQLLGGKLGIANEAQLQLHLALFLKSYGDLYTTQEQELFYVEPEHLDQQIYRGRKSFIDIVAGFRHGPRCAIELKFRTKEQGASDIGSAASFQDLERLERCVLDNNYDLGAFFLVTDLPRFTKQPRLNTGKSNFPIYEGAIVDPTKRSIFAAPGKGGLEKYAVALRHKYTFQWSTTDGTCDQIYFLAILLDESGTQMFS